MKNLKYLIMLLAVMLMIPFSVFAEKEARTAEGNEDSKKVALYFFRGEGCPHCSEAEEWFKSIEEEYGSYFEIKDYETWYNQDNAALMEKVAEARGETADGVPYIIIGDKSWKGFDASHKDEIISEIKTVYEQDVAKRYDVMKFVDSGSKKVENKSSSKDVIALLLIVLVTGGVCFGVYNARKNTN